ncbi:unnamed protein product, partial [marine sediment metagenome]
MSLKKKPDLLASLLAVKIAEENADEAKKAANLCARAKLREPLVEAMTELLSRDIKVWRNGYMDKAKSPACPLRFENGFSADGRFRTEDRYGDRWQRRG